MDLGIQGKTALVAAASRGLGFAAAATLAQEGVNIVICSRAREHIEAAAENIRARGTGDVLPVVADLRQAQEIETLLRAGREKFGHIDILVTNAGGPPAGNFKDIADESWQQGFALTVMSVIRLIRGVLPDMRQNRWGRIVNILSISVKQPIGGLLASNALRPGLVGLAKSLADEVAAEGITVNNVCPGWTRTERVDELLQAKAERQQLSLQEAEIEIINTIPMQRMGRPEELAHLIAFLCSAQASYMTGTTIPVDGGAYRGLM